MKFINLITFCILMEGGKGITDKSPDYVMEKYNRYVKSEREDEFKWGLDGGNKGKLFSYIVKWKMFNQLNKNND